MPSAFNPCGLPAPGSKEDCRTVGMSDKKPFDIDDELPQLVGLLPKEAELVWSHLGYRIFEIMKDCD